MRKLLVVAALLTFGLVATGCDFYGGPLSMSEDDVFKMINNQRASAGNGELEWDGEIAGVAQGYAAYLASKRRTTYVSNADGRTPAQRLQEGGVSFTSCDETGAIGTNIAKASAAYAAMNQSVLTNAAFTRIGLGSKSYSVSSTRGLTKG